jgi:hypothetical protein
VKYQVWKADGLTIAGRHFPHGAVVDSEDMVAKPEPVMVAEDATKDQIAQAQALANERQQEYQKASEKGAKEAEGLAKDGLVLRPVDKPDPPAGKPAEKVLVHPKLGKAMKEIKPAAVGKVVVAEKEG